MVFCLSGTLYYPIIQDLETLMMLKFSSHSTLQSKLVGLAFLSDPGRFSNHTQCRVFLSTGKAKIKLLMESLLTQATSLGFFADLGMKVWPLDSAMSEDWEVFHLGKAPYILLTS